MINAAIIGRLTADPDKRQAGNYDVVNFTVATQNSRKDDQGEYGTDFVRCAVFGNRGNVIYDHFSKGQPIFVTGELYEEHWTDKEGQERQTLSMNVNDFTFVPRDKTQEGGYQGQQNNQSLASPQQPQNGYNSQPQGNIPQPPVKPQAQEQDDFGISDDDLPF